MHYYRRNIGDYHKKAGKLSMLQHGAYTLLIDACYDREKFPTLDEAMEWCWAESPEEIAAVQFVLKKFFDLIDGQYVQNRIFEELENYQVICTTNKEIAFKREEEKRTKRARTVNEPTTNHHLTTNQEPLTINQKPKEKRVAFAPPSLEEVNSFIQEKGYLVSANQFVDFYQSKGWMVGKSKMKDWKAGVRLWQNRNREENKQQPKPRKELTND